MNKYIFPVTLIILDLGAGLVYGFQGDYKKLIYWIAAAILNITVTFQEVQYAEYTTENQKRVSFIKERI